MKDKIEISGGGLKCDNISCNFKNENIKSEDFEVWIDEPCPLCGENLLTKEDYQNVRNLELAVKMTNSMGSEEIDELLKTLTLSDFGDCGFDHSVPRDLMDGNLNKMMSVMVNTHKKIEFSDLKEVKSEEEEVQDGLRLNSVEINKDYRRKWNISSNDYKLITKNGELLRNTLYRVGGLGKREINGLKYFLLLKYVEAFYSDEIMSQTKSTDNKHLEGRWCILDENGDEKVVFDSYKNPYLIKNSCIYSLDRKYYNIETGECYGDSYSTSLESGKYIFIQINDAGDKSGVLRINKKDGTTKLYPKEE